MKIRRFNFSTAALRMILSPGLKHWEVENGLPEDAELVRIAVNEKQSSADIVSLFFTSESFSDLPEGTLLDGENVKIIQHFGQQS